MKKLLIGPRGFKIRAEADVSAYSNSAKVKLIMDGTDETAYGELSAQECASIGKWFLELSGRMKRKKK